MRRPQIINAKIINLLQIPYKTTARAAPCGAALNVRREKEGQMRRNTLLFAPML